MKRGDHVEVNGGDLRWPGIVVAIFKDTNGKRRVVVEHTAKGTAGSLRIYAPDELNDKQEEPVDLVR